MKLKPIWQEAIILTCAVPAWLGIAWLYDNAREVMTVALAMLIGFGLGKLK